MRFLDPWHTRVPRSPFLPRFSSQRPQVSPLWGNRDFRSDRTEKKASGCPLPAFLAVRHTPPPRNFTSSGRDSGGRSIVTRRRARFFHRPCCSGRPSSDQNALPNPHRPQLPPGILRELGASPKPPFLATTEGEQIFAKYSPFPGHQLCSSFRTSKRGASLLTTWRTIFSSMPCFEAIALRDTPATRSLTIFRSLTSVCLRLA